MATSLRQTPTTQQYRAWEGLIRAACASAAAQSSDAIRSVTVSHRTDQLAIAELGLLLDEAAGMAGAQGLVLQAKESPGRLVLSFTRAAPTPATPGTGEQVGLNLKTLWRQLVCQRRE
jgi:hypothetical protein